MKKIFGIIISLVVLATPVFAVTDYINCSVDESSNSNYNHYMQYGTGAQVSYPATINTNSSASLIISGLTLSCARQGGAPESCDTTAGQLAGIGNASFNGIGASFANPAVTIYGQPGDGASVRFNSQSTESFTAPATPGSYNFSGTCNVRGEYSYPEFPYTVTGTLSECSDSINNDNAQGADTLDPQCHTDCNANNPGSYVPNHNSESTPPNGTCPAAATLRLDGQPAPGSSGFFQVIKNFVAFITTKAFAGE